MRLLRPESIDIIPNQSTSGLNSLNHLLNRCVEYQCLLIEKILDTPKSSIKNLSDELDDAKGQPADISAIIEVLKHARNPAGNLAGKLNIQLIANKWCITESEFLEKLSAQDIALISEKLNSLPGKRSFSDNDLKWVLQDLLINKCDAWLKVNDLHCSPPLPSNIKQYSVLHDMIKILTTCLENTKNNVTLLPNQLERFSELLASSEPLFQALKSKTSIFTSSPVLPREFQEIIEESKNLLASQNVSLSINNSAF